MDYTPSSRQVYRSLFWAALFCAALACALFFIRNELVQFFLTRPYVNAVIVVLGIIGLLLSVSELMRLLVQAHHMDSVAEALEDRSPLSENPIEEVVQSMQGGLVANRCRAILRMIRQGTTAMADSVTLLSDADLDSEEGRGVFVRYLIGVMVFLGLIGTFWGVLITVSGVQKVLATMEPAQIDDPTLFVTQLKQSMGGLLGGLSTAFSTSLFGLGGSVIVGFVDVQTRRARAGVLADLDRLVVTGLLPAASPQPETVVPVTPAAPAVTPAPEPGPGELYMVASQEALSENLRTLTDVISDQAVTDEKVAASLVEIRGMLETLREEESLTRDGIQTANQLRHGMLERMDNLGRQIERLVSETRLSRNATDEMGKALLDRLKLEGEITNKTLSIGFSDLARRMGLRGRSEGGRDDTEKDAD